MEKVKTSTELTRHLTEYAKTLGWEIVEWDYLADVDDLEMYQLWLKPTESD